MVGARGNGEGEEEGKKMKWKNNIKTFRFRRGARKSGKNAVSYCTLTDVHTASSIPFQKKKWKENHPDWTRKKVG